LNGKSFASSFLPLPARSVRRLIGQYKATRIEFKPIPRRTFTARGGADGFQRIINDDQVFTARSAPRQPSGEPAALRGRIDLEYGLPLTESRSGKARWC
jgi:hypothetical protein